MASGDRAATRSAADPRIAVALGSPECRVEDPGRVLRMWSVLNEVDDEVHLENPAAPAVARVHRLCQAVMAELERSVSPPLADELRLLFGGGDGEPGAGEVRIEYASLLGWLSGVVIAMLGQLEMAREGRELAERSRPGLPAGATA